MAVDKNSKAYQSLLADWYTDEQISQMHDELASWKSSKEVINENKPANPSPAIWPTGANEHFKWYWDDSSAEWQSYKWGLAEKYTWEWVKNSYIPYDPNITTKDLDPNATYGRDVESVRANEEFYIAKRNDQIASALYNEWKTSREDIANFLMQQNWFMNSSEAARQNTIESIYKRMWTQWDTKWDTKEDSNKKDNIQQELIYWKTTPEEWYTWNWVVAWTDTNAVLNQMEAWRVDNMNTLIQTPPKSIAAALEAWTLSSNMQAVLDVQKNYPEYWAEVESYRKQLQWQETINAISKWEDIPTSTNTVSNANNSIANSAADMSEKYDVSMTDTLNDVHQTLQSNSSAQWAKDSMAEIENEISELNLKLKNLKKEANQIFSWDTPQYIVNAYITNRTQEIQGKLQVLTERYKYASNRYDKEVANAQWEKEYSLKERQVKVQEDTLALNVWKEQNWITTTNTTNTNPTTTTSLSWKELPLTSKNRQQIWTVVDNLVKMLESWEIGNAQCATWVQQYYLPQLWISFWTLSGWGEKLAIRNEWRDYTPQKWDLIIMASWTKPWNWHMGIVIWVTADGKIQYMDWNGDVSWDEKPAIREIDPNSAKIQGYYNATKWQSEWWSQNYDVSIYGVWYDPELWFNPNMNNVYEKILNTDWTWNYPENQAEIAWISVKELWRQANNYADAKKNWYVAYTYPDRDTTNFWYVEWKEQIYENIAKILGNWKQVAWTQQNTYIKQLWLDPKDPNAWDTVVKEVEAYKKWNNQKFDEVKDLIQATEYIISQDASWIQRVNASTKIWMYWEWSSWRTAYKFIKANEALNALADSKWKWATLTPMSDKDFESIKEASMLLNYSDDDANFKRNVENYYNTLRKTAWLNELTQKELDEMWNTESDSKAKWTNYLVLDSASDYDWKYRYHNGKKAYEKTNKSWYDMEAPLFKGNTSSSNSSDVDSEIDDVFAWIWNS